MHMYFGGALVCICGEPVSEHNLFSRGPPARTGSTISPWLPR